MKQKTVYFCNACGNEQPKWFGRCPACGEWGTCTEELVPAKSGSGASGSYSSARGRTRGGLQLPGQKERPKRLCEIEATEEKRMDTHDEELNRVLGGGIVPGSMILLGGDPGIGKSTLVLQTVLQMTDRKILYVSGEESAYQLKMRAGRLAGATAGGVAGLSPAAGTDHCYIVCETSLDEIFVHVADIGPDLLIIDSIQTIATDDLESSAGSVGQVRECAARILKFAKESGTPVILIGHITKEGALAGPKVLEHIVDTVIQFEGDQHYMYRILRAIKNRFGSTSELGIYEMLSNGLRQVTNPSELLLSTRHTGLSGVAIAAAVEGMRPFLIETQALVSTAAYATPMRSTTGFDARRLNMLLAVLEKRVGFKLGQKDVFLNIAGGLRVNDPAMDLAVISSVLSSNMDMPIDMQTCMTGEIGLSGEIRPVSRLEQRIMEAEKLGFTRMLIPHVALKSLNREKLRIQLCPVSKVEEAFRLLFS